MSAVRVVLSLVPWLVPAAALVFAWYRTGTPVPDMAVYAAYLAVAIVLPGVLVFRALVGSRGSMPEDIGLGAATGLVLMLTGWALAAATGRQSLLPAWPLLIIALFVAVPRLRRCWRIPAERRRPLPARWSWIVAAAVLVLVAANFWTWSVTPLPPADAYYYPDLLYHLALVHEMTRSMPFQVPQLAGDVLRYHYLSDADMAAASMITKIPPAVMLLRLWIVPIEAMGILVAAALGRQLSGKWWASALAGSASVLVLPMSLGTPVEASGGSPITGGSPSQTFSVPLLGLLIVLAVEVLGGHRLRWGWLLVFPVALACAGAKSSGLPPFIAGLALAILVVAVRAWRRLLAAGAFLALTAAAMALGIKIFSGGGASSLGLQPLAIIYWMAPYRETIGQYDANDGSLPFPLGVVFSTTAGRVFIAELVCWWLIMQAPRLLGVFAITTRPTRRDPAAWLLAGMAIAGTGGMWLLWHPAASQVYFFLCAVPFTTVLTVWLLAGQARGWRPVVAGLLGGALWAEFAPTVTVPSPPTVEGWALALQLPLLRTAAVAAAAGVVLLFAWRVATGRFAWHAIGVALIAAALGAGLANRVDYQWRYAYEALVRPPPHDHPERAITADEARAALWLDAHAGKDDVVATNVHCAVFTWKDSCDARAFWVAGLGGRRTLVESWAYTDQAVAANLVGGLGFALQPAPYPERFALNQRVFADADPADVAALRDQYHVRWLLADTRAQGGATTGLAKVAKLRYQAGTVSIYELGGPA